MRSIQEASANITVEIHWVSQGGYFLSQGCQRLPRLSEWLGFLEIRSLKAAPYFEMDSFKSRSDLFVSKPLIVSQLGRYVRNPQVIWVIRGIQKFKVYLEDAAMLSISIDAIFPPRGLRSSFYLSVTLLLSVTWKRMASRNIDLIFLMTFLPWSIHNDFSQQYHIC